MFDDMGTLYKNYEQEWELSLPTQVPVILRVDGRAFHTYTRGFKKPFDLGLHGAMVKVAEALCHDIQNARFAYTQSDEISVLIYEKTPESQPWFGNRIQKMCSIAGSIASAVFNEAIAEITIGGKPARDKAYFDARVLSVPVDEVQGYFVWRQVDAIRNSTSGLAQANFSAKELHGKNRSSMLQMLADKGINWHELEDWQKSGSVVVKKWAERLGPKGEVVHRSYWAGEGAYPLFSDNPAFIEQMLAREES